jgi:hypothetical protein
MCDRCEQFAAGSEQYVQALVSASWWEKLRRQIVELFGGCFLWIDAARIAQFVSITALRCHYASSAPFHKIAFPLNLRKQLRAKAFGRLPNHQNRGLKRMSEMVAPYRDKLNRL